MFDLTGFGLADVVAGSCVDASEQVLLITLSGAHVVFGSRFWQYNILFTPSLR